MFLHPLIANPQNSFQLDMWMLNVIGVQNVYVYMYTCMYICKIHQRIANTKKPTMPNFWCPMR